MISATARRLPAFALLATLVSSGEAPPLIAQEAAPAGELYQKLC